MTMRIALSGAAGTGKTRIAHSISEQLGLPYIPDVIDSLLNERGWKSWKDLYAREGEENGKTIERLLRLEALNKKIAEERSHDSYVSDKTVIDYLAYWMAHTARHASPEENETFIGAAREHAQTYDRILVPAFDVFELEDNPEKRNAQYAHRLRIHSLIKGLYHQFTCFFREFAYAFSTPVQHLIEDLQLDAPLTKRIALFLGTFDPVHNGHMAIVQYCENAFDEVLIQPHPDTAKTAVKHQPLDRRVAMLETAMRAHPKTALRQFRAQTNYRTHSFTSLQEEFPAADIWMAMGSDKLDHPAYTTGELIAVPHLVFVRDALSSQQVETLKQFQKARIVEGVSNLSATLVKQKQEGGDDIALLVPEEVHQYVLENNLYAD